MFDCSQGGRVPIPWYTGAGRKKPSPGGIKVPRKDQPGRIGQAAPKAQPTIEKGRPTLPTPVPLPLTLQDEQGQAPW